LQRLGSTRATTDAGVHVGLATACVLQHEATRADAEPNVDALRLAVTHAREASELSPGHAEAWATLGFVLDRSGERENAVAALRRAVKIDPRNWLHHLRLAYASWGRDRIAAAERVLALMPGQPLACVLMASVFVARGALAEAELALDPGLRTMATDVGGPSTSSAVALYFVKGLLFLARGDEDDALASFERELALEALGHLYARECCAHTWTAIGAVHLGRGDRARARGAFEQATARVAPHPLALAGLAILGSPKARDPQAATPLPSATTGVSVDLAMARAARLVADGDARGAAGLVGTAIAAAPPGDAGWRVPIEPLLGVQRARDAWSVVLEQLRRRAV
jgi:tetratricopeptide (TPR) repeat protein